MSDHPEKLVCRNCHEEFTPVRNTQVFCSPECLQADALVNDINQFARKKRATDPDDDFQSESGRYGRNL